MCACVCMCVCMCACVCACVHSVCMCVCAHLCIVCMCVVHVCMVCVCVHACVHTCVCVYVCMVCYVCVCMHYNTYSVFQPSRVCVHSLKQVVGVVQLPQQTLQRTTLEINGTEKRPYMMIMLQSFPHTPSPFSPPHSHLSPSSSLPPLPSLRSPNPPWAHSLVWKATV